MSSLKEKATGDYSILHGVNDFSARERDKLLYRSGDDWVDVSYLSGADSPQDGRVFAVADLDHDGRPELIVVDRNAPLLHIYHSDSISRGDVLGLRIMGGPGNTDAVGARITARCGERLMTRLVQVGTGFSTQNSFTLPLGLGSCANVDELKITWPDGLERTFASLASDEFYRVPRSGPLERVPSWFRRSARVNDAAPPPIASIDSSLAGAKSLAPGAEAIADWSPQRPLVYLTFWASWCTACKTAQPSLDALAARYGDRIDFAGASLDPADVGAVVAQYGRDHRAGYPLLALDGPHRDALEAAVRPLFHGMPALPSGVLYERSTGRVLLRRTGVPTVSDVEAALAR